MANKTTNKELLARLDERSLNTWRTLRDIKKLLEEQNGRIRRNTIAIAFIVGTLGVSGSVFGIINLIG